MMLDMDLYASHTTYIGDGYEIRFVTKDTQTRVRQVYKNQAVRQTTFHQFDHNSLLESPNDAPLFC